MMTKDYFIAITGLLCAFLHGIIGLYLFVRQKYEGGKSLFMLVGTMFLFCLLYTMNVLNLEKNAPLFFIYTFWILYLIIPPFLVITTVQVIYHSKMHFVFIVVLLAIFGMFSLPLTNILFCQSDALLVNRLIGNELEIYTNNAHNHNIFNIYFNLSLMLCAIIGSISFFISSSNHKKGTAIVAIASTCGLIIGLLFQNKVQPMILSTFVTISLSYAFIHQQPWDNLPLAFDALFEHLPDGVLLVDEKGKITAHNISAVKILGTTIDNNTSLREILPLLLESCAETKIEGNCIIEQGDSKNKRWIDIRGNVFQSKNGNTVRVITLRDVTEIKRLEQQIQHYQKSLRNEIAALRNIQATLFPDFSKIPNYDIACVYIPAGELSGDFIDGYFVDDETYQIVICDVMGHGLASAYLGMEIRSLFRAISLKKLAPSEILAEVNNILVLDFSQVLYFATAAIVQIHFPTHQICYSSAGHPPSLHRTNKNTINQIGFTGSLMGLRAGNAYEDVVINFSSNEYFLMYTDGVTEAHNNILGENYGIERLMQEFVQTTSSALETVHLLSINMFQFTDFAPIEDDITLLCFKRKD